MNLIRFLHVTLAVTFSGVILANYFYISLAIKEKNFDVLTFSLKNSLLSDCIFSLPTILIVFTTGSYQVFFLKLFGTPWVLSAYLFFLVVTFFWLVLFILKSYNYIVMEKNSYFKGKNLFHFSYSIILLLLIFIIHDAVRKVTFIPWQLIYNS